MGEVIVGDSVSSDDVLWRYMSLDKLVNLLSTKTLYLSPLSHYEKTDPYEGYLPKIALKTLGDVIIKGRKEIKKEIVKAIDLHNRNKRNGIENKSAEPHIKLLQAHLESDNKFIREAYVKIIKSIAVNCWHCNINESEAMWRLYSENGNGVAIKTSVSSLKNSLKDYNDERDIRIGRVKYIDFNDSSLKSSDCTVDNQLSPLIKRRSFSHENEVRIYSNCNIDFSDFDNFKPKPKIINVNINHLIEGVYISPYSTEPYPSSVMSICEQYGLDKNKIIKSELLDGWSDLLDAFDV
ncbi:DUF2971 domain-containing protein [Yersinia enterocolitica]